jgi:hypothetical protein
MTAAKRQPGSRLMTCIPALPLLLLLAAQAAPAEARGEPQNRTGGKSAQNTELHRPQSLQTLEMQRENALLSQYDTPGDSITEKERSG